MLQREVEFRRQSFNAVLQLSFSDSGQGIEHGLNDRGVQNNHAHLEHKHESHKPWNEIVGTGPFEDVEECGEERRSEQNGNEPRLDHVRDKDPWRGLVETVFLFQNECRVDGQWDSWNGRKEVESEAEHNALHNLLTISNAQGRAA